MTGSYGGAVITGAAAGNPNVKALVYIAAFAPEAGEPIGAFGEKYPAPLGAALRPDAAGFLYIDRAQFHHAFCCGRVAGGSAGHGRDAEADQRQRVQRLRAAAGMENDPVAVYRHSGGPGDQSRARALLRQRMGARTTEVKSSHVPFISRPREVARVIEQAANAAR